MKKVIFCVLTVVAGVFVAVMANAQNNDTIKVALKNSYLVEGEESEEGIFLIKKVDKIEHPEKTIEIQLSYGSFGTMLSVSNPFDRTLKYRAFIYSPEKKDYVETSILPVFPGISGFETWGGKIPEIILTGFELVD